jgi:glutamate dehydrogenase
MKHMPQDLRTQTLALVTANKPAADSSQVEALIQAWLASLDDEDLAGTSPDSLAPILWEGFSQAAKRSAQGCQIAQLRCTDGRGGMATALLVLNDDMPYLVDSIVMAMRKQRVSVSGVMNAVLGVSRDANGTVTAVGTAGAAPESYVLCLLAEDLPADELAALVAKLHMVARDAAVVRRDSVAMADRLTSVAAGTAALNTPEGQEAAAFLEWAKNEGFEPFGYAYYVVTAGERELETRYPEPHWRAAGYRAPRLWHLPGQYPRRL